MWCYDIPDMSLCVTALLTGGWGEFQLPGRTPHNPGLTPPPPPPPPPAYLQPPDVFQTTKQQIVDQEGS